MKKRFLSIILCLFLVIGLLPATAFAETTIDSVDIFITYPVHSANPEYFVQVYGNCEVHDVPSSGFQNGARWTDMEANDFMRTSDAFVGGKQYGIEILLAAKPGYSFSSSTVFTINAETAVHMINTDGTLAVVGIILTADNLYIHNVTVTGLDAPVAGKTPDFSAGVQENTCSIYSTAASSGITWYDHDRQVYLSENDTFQAGHRYSASIYLQAQQGYAFPQNTQVTANGKACTATVQNNGQMLKAVLEYPALAEEHTHTPSAWRITGAYHYTACTTCGDFLEQEDHTGGVATCAEKGKCAVCGYEYIDVTENHTPDTTQWVIRGDMYHYHACKLCGAHCDIGDHIAGPAGTPDAAVVCRDCGYIITPAKGHTHNLTKVAGKEATCTEPGNPEYYTCDGCSDLFADSLGNAKITDIVIAPLGHTASDDWKYDENRHWHTCSVCGEILAETQTDHSMAGGRCTDCGFGGAATAPVPSAPAGTAPGSSGGQPQNEGGGLPWWVFVLIGLAAVGAGLGGVVLVLNRKKKE